MARDQQAPYPSLGTRTTEDQMVILQVSRSLIARVIIGDLIWVTAARVPAGKNAQALRDLAAGCAAKGGAIRPAVFHAGAFAVVAALLQAREKAAHVVKPAVLVCNVAFLAGRHLDVGGEGASGDGDDEGGDKRG